MVPLFYIIWYGPAGELHSFNVMTGAWQDNPLTYGVCFPGDTTVSQNVTLTGSGLRRRSYETLVNTSLFLAGDTATLAAIQGWAQVSFDDVPLPFAARLPEPWFDMPVTPLAEGVAATVELYRRAAGTL